MLVCVCVCASHSSIAESQQEINIHNFNIYSQFTIFSLAVVLPKVWLMCVSGIYIPVNNASLVEMIDCRDHLSHVPSCLILS